MYDELKVCYWTVLNIPGVWSSVGPGGVVLDLVHGITAAVQNNNVL